MATEYQLNFTDQSLGPITIAPYTTDGPLNPNSNLPDPKSTKVSTSLLFYSRGMPNYGERLQENMLQMMEHFASSTEPTFPIPGQLWFDRSTNQLRVFNPFWREIESDVNPNNFSVTPDPNLVNDATNLFNRFSQLERVRIFNNGSPLEQEEYLVTTVTNGNPVILTVSGVPASRAGWFIGGWEQILQTNLLDAGGYRFTNVGEPIDDQDAATKKYVDDIFSGAAISFTLNDLSDVSITSLAVGDILVYTGAGWENQPQSSTFLALSGGTMTGDLILNDDPTYSMQAATKNYVDTQINSLIPGATTLGGLTDVSISGSPSLTNGQVLTYDDQLMMWVNRDVPTPPADPTTMYTTGGQTMTGYLTLNANPIAPLHAATKNYVDTYVAANDKYVTNANYDNSTKLLSIIQPSEPTITVDFSDLATSSSITHNIPLPIGYANSAFDEMIWDDGTYPVIKTEALLNQLDYFIGRANVPNDRIVFVVSGGSPNVDVIVNFTSSVIPGQINPALSAGTNFAPYTVGSNKLTVYKDGIKQYASVPGFREIRSNASVGSPSSVGILHKGAFTGLNAGTTYSFRIDVNGQGPVQIDVDGTLAPQIGHIIDIINTYAETYYFGPERNGGSPAPDPKYAFGATLVNGSIRITSGLPGTGSSIDLVDGPIAGFNLPLWANVVGNGITGIINIDLPLSNGLTNPYAPITLAYDEIGRPGQHSYRFKFVVPPTNGSTIEVIIEPDMYGSSVL